MTAGDQRLSNWLASIGLADGTGPRWKVALKASPASWDKVVAIVGESPLSLSAFECIRAFAPEELERAANQCKRSLDRLNSIYRNGEGKSTAWIDARDHYETSLVEFRDAAKLYRNELLGTVQAWRTGGRQPPRHAPAKSRHPACTETAAERIQSLAISLRARARSSTRAQPLAMADSLRVLGLDRAYHIASIENIASICSLGILPHSLAPRSRVDISNPSIQDRRAIVEIDLGRQRVKLHDFVPMFYAAKTPMLWERADPLRGVGLDNLCTIEFAIGDLASWCETLVVTSRNAASNGMTASADPARATIVPVDVVRRNKWNDLPDGGLRRAAELLCFPLVPAPAISIVHVDSVQVASRVKERLRGVGATPAVKVSPEHFPVRN